MSHSSTHEMNNGRWVGRSVGQAWPSAALFHQRAMPCHATHRLGSAPIFISSRSRLNILTGIYQTCPCCVLNVACSSKKMGKLFRCSLDVFCSFCRANLFGRGALSVAKCILIHYLSKIHSLCSFCRLTAIKSESKRPINEPSISSATARRRTARPTWDTSESYQNPPHWNAHLMQSIVCPAVCLFTVYLLPIVPGRQASRQIGAPSLFLSSSSISRYLDQPQSCWRLILVFFYSIPSSIYILLFIFLLLSICHVCELS